MPKTIQPINDEDEQRIRKNFVYLKEELDQSEIRDALIVEDIWDFKDIHEIDAQPTPNQKNEAFLKLLRTSGPDAYSVFIDALRAKGCEHIIKRLEDTPITENAQADQVDRYADLTEAQRSLNLTDIKLLKFNKVCGGDMGIVGKAFGLSQFDIDVVRMENQFSVATQIHHIMLKWKNNGRNASLGNFTKALIDAEKAGAKVDWGEFSQGVRAVSEN